MSRAWASHTAKIVAEIESKFELPVPCSTYRGHGVMPSGRDGEAFGIDVWIAPYGQRANKAQEKLGDEVQKFLEANWDRLGIHYVIWWGWMSYRPGQWFKYNPATYSNPIASPDPDTVMHMDHVHIQVTEANNYKPPKDAAPVPDVGRGVDDKALVALIDKHLNGMGRVIVDEAERADLHVDLACALVEQESNGRNIFGCDHGNVGDRPPYCHQAATKERVQALRTGGSYRHGMNGIGPVQLTWWEFVEKAEALGGAHIPANNCRVGFTDLVSMLDVEGFGYLEALGAYNAGRSNYQLGITNGYAGAVAAKHRVWKARINALPKAPEKPSKPPPAPAPKPTLEERLTAVEKRLSALEQPAFAQPIEVPIFVSKKPVEDMPPEREEIPDPTGWDGPPKEEEMERESNDRGDLNPKVPAATGGGVAGVLLAQLIVWLMETYTSAGDVPVGIEAIIGLLLVAGLAFGSGYMRSGPK
jgi:hypothetical protein